MNTVLRPDISLKPAESSILMRPADSVASQWRCVIVDLLKLGQHRR